MFLYAGKAGRQWCLGIACLLGVVFAATPAFAQFDRGQISGVVKDRDRRGGAGRHRDSHASFDADATGDRDRRERLLYLRQPASRPLQHQRRAAGVQEISRRRASSSMRPAL